MGVQVTFIFHVSFLPNLILVFWEGVYFLGFTKYSNETDEVCGKRGPF